MSPKIWRRIALALLLLSAMTSLRAVPAWAQPAPETGTDDPLPDPSPFVLPVDDMAPENPALLDSDLDLMSLWDDSLDSTNRAAAASNPCDRRACTPGPPLPDPETLDCRTYNGGSVLPIRRCGGNSKFLCRIGEHSEEILTRLVGVSADAGCHLALGDTAKCRQDNWRSVIDNLGCYKLNKMRLWVFLNGDPEHGSEHAGSFPFKYDANGHFWRLDIVNKDYFDRIVQVVSRAKARNIYVEVTFFAPWEGDWGPKDTLIPTGPLVGAGGTNGRMCASLPGADPCPQSLDVAGFSDLKDFVMMTEGRGASGLDTPLKRARQAQRNVIAWTVERLWCFDNVFFEIANEPEAAKNGVSGVTADGVAVWQAEMIKALSEAENGKPQLNDHHHLIAVQPYTADGAYYAFGLKTPSAGDAHELSQVGLVNGHYTTVNRPGAPRLEAGALDLARNYTRTKPVGFNETAISGIVGNTDPPGVPFSVFLGSEPCGAATSARSEAWEFLLDLGAVYDHFGYSYDSDNGQKARQQMCYLKTFLDKLPLGRLKIPTPKNDTAPPPVIPPPSWVTVGGYAQKEADDVTFRYWAAVEPDSTTTAPSYVLYLHRDQLRCVASATCGCEQPNKVLRFGRYHPTNAGPVTVTLTLKDLRIPSGQHSRNYLLSWVKPETGSTIGKASTLTFRDDGSCTFEGVAKNPCQVTSRVFQYDIALWLSTLTTTAPPDTGPVVANPDSFSTLVNTRVQIRDTDLTANDTPGAVFVRAENPLHGTLEIAGVAPDGVVYNFLPDPDFVGTASFEYLISADGYEPYTRGYVTVTVGPVAVARFTASCDYLYCTFDPGASTPANAITGYSWTWGDGTSQTNPTNAPVVHNFSAAGDYPVTLTASVSPSNQGSTSQIISVASQPPTVVITVGCDHTYCVFDYILQSGSAGIQTWSWSFGDGTSGSGPHPIHTYAHGGTYTVTLLATDVYGLSTSPSIQLVVSDPPSPPVPSFTASCPSLTCNFDASSSAPGSGTITGYAWSFGDAASGSGVTASHTYAAAGARTVTLTVTNSFGLSATASRTVQPDALPAPRFTVSCSGLTCSFDASSSTDDFGITAYAWSFGDGATGSGVTASHTYAAVGNYGVTLTVTDTVAHTASTTQTVNPDPKPVACFTWTCFQRTCTFDGRCSTDNQPLASYLWSFGDGATGSGATVSHTYSVGGPYNVTLTVTDSVSQPNAKTNPILVHRPPVAGNDTASTPPNTAVDINVLANDSDPDNDPLTVVLLTAPLHGTVNLNANTVHYTPAAGYVGTDSFQYRDQDPQDPSNNATVTVSVNNAPIPRDDGWSTAQNVATNIPYSSLLANDYDPDGDALTVSAVNATGLAGTLDCSSGTYCRFTPAPPFAGLTSFTYTASDGRGGTAQATVRIKVGLANTAPAPQDDLLETPRNTPLVFTRATLLANDTDPNGDILSVTAVYLSTLTAQGTVACSAAYYTCTYTPPMGFTGVDVLYYRASDGIATTDARIRILVRPPTPAVLDAREDQLFFTSAGGTFLSYSWMTANDYAPQGGALTVVNVDTTGLLGTLDCTTFSTGCEYTRGTSDPTRFRYTVRDSLGNQDTATVILKPGNAAFNRGPVVANDTLATRMNTPVAFSIFDLLKNDYDPDNDQLNLAFTTYTTAHGRLTCSSPVYTCTYTPNTGFTGADTLTYVVNDGNNTAQATVTVTVNP